jgi:hypothetical protein
LLVLPVILGLATAACQFGEHRSEAEVAKEYAALQEVNLGLPIEGWVEYYSLERAWSCPKANCYQAERRYIYASVTADPIVLAKSSITALVADGWIVDPKDEISSEIVESQIISAGLKKKSSASGTGELRIKIVVSRNHGISGNDWKKVIPDDPAWKKANEISYSLSTRQG